MEVRPPLSEAELLTRAETIAGRTLAFLASRLVRDLPPDLTRHKGWVGHLIEDTLGARAGTRPEPDFPRLGIELKTIPIDLDGKPRESTFVCKAALADVGATTWATSTVRKKLARVLWIPVEADQSIALADRRVGTPMLWSPSPEHERVLEADFEELAQLIEEGWIGSVTAHRGRYLQLRPKGASAASRARGIDEHGAPMATPPRGFYLRRSFTAALLAERFVVARR